MRLQITGHAVERWCELEDPPLPYRDALAELREVAADASALSVAGRTAKGQHVLEVAAPRPAFLVVKLGPKSARSAERGTGLAGGVIVTVYPPHLWRHNQEALDEAAEVGRAWTAARDAAPPRGAQLAPAAPGETTPKVPPAPPSSRRRSYPTSVATRGRPVTYRRARHPT